MTREIRADDGSHAVECECPQCAEASAEPGHVQRFCPMCGAPLTEEGCPIEIGHDYD